jgi:hypothetical protein
VSPGGKYSHLGASTTSISSTHVAGSTASAARASPKRPVRGKRGAAGAARGQHAQQAGGEAAAADGSTTGAAAPDPAVGKRASLEAVTFDSLIDQSVTVGVSASKDEIGAW